MAPTPFSRSKPTDAVLMRRLAAGDQAAFAAIDVRYRQALIRYARTLLRRSDHDAEDVVQDVLIRALALLCAGDGPVELKPWLYRLVRNRSIDEVRKARWGAAALDDEAAALQDPTADPDAVLRRRESIRRLVEDLADLPVNQRTALLAREVDGASPQAIAAELGVSAPAAQMLASRARQGLVKKRDARDADCYDVRGALADAHERGVRPTEHASRHLRDCADCRAHQRDLKRLSRRLHHAFAPPIGILPIAAAAKLLGGGASKGAVAATAAVAVVAVTGGVVVAATSIFKEGEPAPFELRGVKALVGHGVKGGQAIPKGTAVVVARVRIGAGTPETRRSITLACPAGMKVAGLQSPEQDFPLGYGLARPADIGTATRSRITFGRTVLARTYEASVGLLCKVPRADGGLTDLKRPLKAGETKGRICAEGRSTYVHHSPGRVYVGTVYDGEPVAVGRRSASGRWTFISPDVAQAGWVKTTDLCP